MKVWAPVPFVLLSIVFVLAGVATTVDLTCPLCHGSGILPAARGLKVESVESRLINQTDTFKFSACGNPVKAVKYIYAVDMVLTNESTELSEGSVSIVFNPGFSGGYHVLIGEGEGEDAVVVEGDAPPTPLYSYVVVPAGVTKNIKLQMPFIDQEYHLPPGSQADPHSVIIESGKDIPDATCGATGKLTFVKWLQVKVLKMVLK